MSGFRVRFLVLAAFAVFSQATTFEATAYAQPSAGDAVTIKHLLSFVEKSKLSYFWNGREHDSESAAKHLSDKYERLISQIYSPEGFIEKTSARSILSGQPYLVKMPNGAHRAVSEVLREELIRYRVERTGVSSRKK